MTDLADFQVHILLGTAVAVFGALRIAQICFFDHDPYLTSAEWGSNKSSIVSAPPHGQGGSVLESIVQHMQNYVSACL